MPHRPDYAELAWGKKEVAEYLAAEAEKVNNGAETKVVLSVLGSAFGSSLYRDFTITDILPTRKGTHVLVGNTRGTTVAFLAANIVAIGLYEE